MFFHWKIIIVDWYKEPQVFDLQEVIDLLDISQNGLLKLALNRWKKSQKILKIQFLAFYEKIRIGTF